MSTTESDQIYQPPTTPLRGSGLAVRLTAIVGAIVVTAGLFLYAGGWFTPHKLTPAGIVNTFEYLNGVHSGFRRNHAKGVCITGYFESNGQAQTISKAQVFLPGRVPIVGRFALAGGLPYADDTPKTIRSLAILFNQPDGEEWRTAMVNIPVFVVNTPQAFNEFQLASSPDPATGKNIPGAMPAFLANHPETAAALKVIGTHPFSSGFGDSPYYALNAFRFVNAQGESTPVRWYLAPDQTFEANSTAPTGKNYLFDGLIAQLHAKPLRWNLMLIVGQPGDSTADATQVWPSDRKQINAGALTINTIESEATSPTRDINFDPLVLPDGISPSDDPLLSARSAAYSQSFRRREGEHKEPSAISTSEVEK
ncbi:MAG TPA: catalase family peroxidase [Bryobacteraceae bacterium]|jgi:catalase|nr:catalase family peroxidase [Bryobacteraceae bacterium]